MIGFDKALQDDQLDLEEDKAFQDLELRGHCKVTNEPRVRVFMDGDQWCAVLPNFVNLQESPAGFGDTPEQAYNALIVDRNKHSRKV